MFESIQMTDQNPKTTSGKATLLFVDDDPDMLALYSRMLEREDYRIFQATSAEEARTIIEREPVDIAIVDMIMPEINGAQFLRELQSSHPNIKRFLVTGQSNLADSVEGITELEADHYVLKPVSAMDLKEMCQEALADKGA